jgi:hypothetical protein
VDRTGNLQRSTFNSQHIVLVLVLVLVLETNGNSEDEDEDELVAAALFSDRRRVNVAAGADGTCSRVFDLL